jgi:hypothetical protein
MKNSIKTLLFLLFIFSKLEITKINHFYSKLPFFSNNPAGKKDFFEIIDSNYVSSINIVLNIMLFSTLIITDQMKRYKDIDFQSKIYAEVDYYSPLILLISIIRLLNPNLYEKELSKNDQYIITIYGQTSSFWEFGLRLEYVLIIGFIFNLIIGKKKIFTICSLLLKLIFYIIHSFYSKKSIVAKLNEKLKNLKYNEKDLPDDQSHGNIKYIVKK